MKRCRMRGMLSDPPLVTGLGARRSVIGISGLGARCWSAQHQLRFPFSPARNSAGVSTNPNKVVSGTINIILFLWNLS